MNSTAQDFLITTVTAKHREANKVVGRFIRLHYTNTTDEMRKQSLEDAIAAMVDLENVVHKNFRPDWIREIISNLTKFQRAPNTDHGINGAYVVATTKFPEMQKHQWKFLDDQPSGFDFDQIFEDAKTSNRIPELFDEIIGVLQEISTSGAIDSVRILNELASIISTLRNARNGSYLATRHAWYFLVEWLKNTGWEALGDIPVLGAPVRGLRATLEETNTAMDKMHTEMAERINSSLGTELPRLPYDQPRLPAPEPEPEPETT